MAQDKKLSVTNRVPIPMRPIALDNENRPRFQENEIVRFLLEHGSIDLNELCRRFRDPSPDWEEFYQLIGYSVNGYCELSVVSVPSAAAAELIGDKLREDYETG